MNHDDQRIDGHPADDLEAYALGILDARDGVAIEDHVATCGDCLRRLGRAEETVATLLAFAPLPTQPQSQVPSPSASSATARTTIPRRPVLARSIAALAAAVVVLAGARIVSLERALDGDGTLVHAMIASHFLHAQFRAPDGRPLDAKVVYDRAGRWYEILTTDATERVAVVASEGGEPRALDERLEARGPTAVLRVTPPAPLVGFELRDTAGTLLGRVDLPHARER